MKRFVLAFIGLFLLAQAAVALPSALTFTSRRGEVFQVLLNGQLMNRGGSTHLRLDLVPPGVHTVEVRVFGPFHTFSQRARIEVPEGYESNFVVQLAGWRGNVILRKVRVAPLPDHAVSLPPPPAPERPRYRNPEPAPDACSYLLPEEELTRLLDTMDRDQPDSRRTELAKQVIRNNGILTEDLRLMVEQLEQEEARLELAKFGYDAVCDKQNFYKLFSLFEYDKNVRELEQHMQR